MTELDASIFILVLMVFLVTSALAGFTAERILHAHHNQKVDFFIHHPVRPGDIVFLGDSITDGARWDEIFPGYPVKNRGINSDTVQGVLHRLTEIIVGHPAAIFLLIGTNNLPFWVFDSNQEILVAYEKILTRIKEGSPQTKVFIQSVFPRQRRFNRRIIALNAGLQALAEKFNYTFIDIHTHMVDDHGELRTELTNDHLHILSSGYLIWEDIVRPYIEKLVG